MVSEEEFKRRMKETPAVEYFDLIKHGEGLFRTWTELTFQKPPEDIFGRILWSLGVLGQLLLSWATFPAALASFLLEEAVQTYGMGAFMLSSARAYDIADPYIDSWINFIDAATVGAKTLATINPITGGAVLIYMGAAKQSALAFEAANDRNLLIQAEKDEKQRQKLIDDTKYAHLRLQSSPSQAQIFMNGEDLQLVTPETFKELEAGSYDITLKKYSAAREVEETVSFTVTLEAGRKKEIYARIPKIIDGVTEDIVPPDETDNPQLPPMIKAEVTGEYAIDGDTFITTTGERIRILGIDAPELNRPWYEESREALTILVEDKKIQLKIQSHKPLDTHGRTLAICNSWKGDIAIFQLSSGLARVLEFDDDIFDYTKYYSAEQIAKDRKIGIWS